MGTHRRWSKEAKLAILEEAERNGIAQTSRKHGIAASQVHDWKKKFQLLGEAGLSGYVQKEDAETQRLRLENQALKEMIAEQALALRIKDSLLKKTEQRLRSGS
jgi:transposase-like protein